MNILADAILYLLSLCAIYSSMRLAVTMLDRQGIFRSAMFMACICLAGIFFALARSRVGPVEWIIGHPFSVIKVSAIYALSFSLLVWAWVHWKRYLLLQRRSDQYKAAALLLGAMLVIAIRQSIA